MALSDYRRLSRHILETTFHHTELADGTIIRVECFGAHHGQIDGGIRASLNGDTLASINFVSHEGVPSNIDIKDWRNGSEGGDLQLIAQMMVILQSEFPKKMIPGLVYHDAYDLVRTVETVNYPLLKKINRARDLKKTWDDINAMAASIEHDPNRSERDTLVLNRLWDKGYAAINELDEMKGRGDLPENWETSTKRPTITIIKGLKSGKSLA